jgi:hypothetical protein
MSQFIKNFWKPWFIYQSLNAFQWERHVERMGEKRTAYKSLAGKQRERDH